MKTEQDEPNSSHHSKHYYYNHVASIKKFGYLRHILVLLAVLDQKRIIFATCLLYI